MAQLKKLQAQTEIKSSADKFYEILRSKAYLIPKICPNYVKDIRVLQGDWDTVGSLRVWTYVAVKETMEAIDEKSRRITFNMLEGEIMNYYKSYKLSMEVASMGKGSLVKWTVEYEKQNEEISPPHKYLEFLVNFSKSIDAYLLTNKAEHQFDE
ncbi:MLP-like protein 28 isoform X2 [Jatropha curcas]|uniref:MLP-like protein 28 isoform X2 n=1 Tax=Jatropha curcas TaxID=180498 RepID=UPI0009D72047|nr:MLP-like protein 28 isoform X2 [Jatropha curcas]